MGNVLEADTAAAKRIIDAYQFGSSLGWMAGDKGFVARVMADHRISSTVALWMDIRTAPKNGDHIIVAVTGGPHGPTVCEAYWHVVDGDWWLGATSPADYYSSPISDIMHGTVSHWMPLPPPPEPTEAGR